MEDGFSSDTPMSQEEQDVLFKDSITGLPTLAAVFRNITEIVTKTNNLGIIYIDVERYSKIEEIYGWEKFDQIMEMVKGVLLKIKGDIIRATDIITVNRSGGDDFLIFLSTPRKSEIITSKVMDNIRRRIQKEIQDRINQQLPEFDEYQFEIFVGFSIVINNPVVRIERQINREIRRAMRVALDQQEKEKYNKLITFNKIIDDKSIYMVFQPIVSLASEEVLGFEALARGPKNTEYASPEVLFSLAKETGKIWELERLCRKATLKTAKTMSKGQRLFLNIEPVVINDPVFRRMEFLKGTNFSPKDIVLEITERTAISNFDKFKQSLVYFKEKGFNIAVDDAGSGYASLQAIAELKPEFLKFDISLVHNIDDDSVKQQLLETLLVLARSIGAKVIGEGIETKNEYETLKRLGVDYGQGFYIARPAEMEFKGENLA